MKKSGRWIGMGLAIVVLAVAMPSFVWAHCDTEDGPTAIDGKAALERGDIKPALKWVAAESEKELKEVFEHVLKVRKTGPEAKVLADHYFLETLIRLHRASEGAPYTGLKPAGTELPHFIAAADKAVETGSVEKVVDHLSNEIKGNIEKRFARLMTAKGDKDSSVEAGREYVAAYVDYVHYVEAVADLVTGKGAHEEHTQAGSAAHSHTD